MRGIHMQIVRRAYAYAYVEFYAHERKVVLRRTSNVVRGRISSRDRGVGRFVPRVPRLLRRKNAACDETLRPLLVTFIRYAAAGGKEREERAVKEGVRDERSVAICTARTCRCRRCR